jgi:8-oxo-dGTP diphosphatase
VFIHHGRFTQIIKNKHPRQLVQQMQISGSKKHQIVNATLVYLLKGDPTEEILLGYKKDGFGKGKFVGYGGKIEAGETLKQAAARELAEESGIQLSPTSLNYVADIVFLFPGKPEWNHRVHAFTASANEIEPIETSEMIPHWFPISSIPYDEMWDDSRYWLPRIISGDRITAKFIFNSDNATVGEVKFTPMNGS